MKYNKQKIFNYNSHKVNKQIYDDGSIQNEYFSLDDKIEYYSKRMNNKKLNSSQRNYAKIKISMLTSGIGRIFTINDTKLGNKEKNAKDKHRRVIPTAINYKNGNVLINGIYTSPKDFRPIQIHNADPEGRIFILNRTSYLDIEAKKQLNGDYFNINDLTESSSTINPFDLNKVITTIYPKKEKNDFHEKNNIKRKSLIK